MKLIKHVNLLENKKMILWMNAASIILLLLFGTLLSVLVFSKISETNERLTLDVWETVAALIGYFILIVAHELIHGIFFKVFAHTGKIKFGFKNGMAYATSPGSRYSKGKFAIICLAPFVVITTFLFIIWQLGLISSLMFIFVTALHGAGCVGDFYWVYLAIRAPENSLIEDTEVGIDFYA